MTKMKTSKYKVTLNWSGELHTFWTSSSTEKRALENAVTRLAQKLGKSSRMSVKRSFFGEKDNYTIERR